MDTTVCIVPMVKSLDGNSYHFPGIAHVDAKIVPAPLVSRIQALCKPNVLIDNAAQKKVMPTFDKTAIVMVHKEENYYYHLLHDAIEKLLEPKVRDLTVLVGIYKWKETSNEAVSTDILNALESMFEIHSGYSLHVILTVNEDEFAFITHLNRKLEGMLSNKIMYYTSN